MVPVRVEIDAIYAEIRQVPGIFRKSGLIPFDERKKNCEESLQNPSKNVPETSEIIQNITDLEFRAVQKHDNPGAR